MNKRCGVRTEYTDYPNKIYPFPPSKLVLDLLSRNLPEPLAGDTTHKPRGLGIALAEVRTVDAVLLLARVPDQALDLQHG